MKVHKPWCHGDLIYFYHQGQHKTIMFLPAHRYNLGRCTKEEFNHLNDHLSALFKMDNPRHILGALSYQYLRRYTGIDALLLYSASVVHTSGIQYNPIRKEIIAIARNLSYLYIRTLVLLATLLENLKSLTLCYYQNM